MKYKRLFSIYIIIILLISSVPVVTLAEGNTTTIIDSYNTYYNYYYLNDTEFDYVDLFSLNNRDVGAYWRPKYEELSLPLKEYIEFNDKNVKMNKNAFDVEWKDINKNSLPTSRALEILGYDFLLYTETVENTGKNTWYDLDDDGQEDEYHYEVNRVLGYKQPITAPYYIMNIYKALGINLYDVYFEYKRGTAQCGAYITRTNPNSYWKLFLNNHPIDYSVYNDLDVSDISVGQTLTTADGITILAQMLDFYGEPVISKQEEYMLLQVYGDDVPSTLSDSQKSAWSYLKCRGIIGEEELQYDTPFSFEDMMDLLMRAKDRESRTNFKEIQITTNLDDEFIRNGYYQNDVTMINQPSVSPIESKIVWNSATRYDFLIEMDNNIAFKFQNTGELNRDIFISKGPLHNDSPIKGSIFEGIVNGRFYHFSIPINELKDVSMLYVNSSKSGDLPLNYYIPLSSNRIGGVYSRRSGDSSGSIVYQVSNTFQEILPESMYVDLDRYRAPTDVKKVSAAGGVTIRCTFSTELLDVESCNKVIQGMGGTSTVIDSGSKLQVSIDASSLGDSRPSYAPEILARRLVLKPEYIYKSDEIPAILGLTGSRLLVNLTEAESIKLIKGYKIIPDKKVIIIYTADNDIVIVDNKNKIIQKGNTYLQIREEQPLYTTDGSNILVDFRALYGTKEIGFTLGQDATTGGTTVTMYNNAIKNEDNNVRSITYRVNEYSYYSTDQYLPYDTDANSKTRSQSVDLLYKFRSNTSTNMASEVEEVLLPFTSSNVMGNYILYGEYDSNYGLENYYLVSMSPKNVLTSETISDGDYKTMFLYSPSTLPESKYTVNVIKLDTSSESKYGIKQVPGVGWCYNLRRINDTLGDKISFMNRYRNQSSLLPFAITYNNRVPKMVNFNINYFDEESIQSLTIPSTDLKVTPIPAVVGIQSWFTNPELVPTISKETITSKVGLGSVPVLFYGTMEAKVDLESKSIITVIGGINVGKYMGLRILGMNKIFGANTGENSYLSPGIYSLTSDDLDMTLSTDKDIVKDTTIDRKSAKIQEFFEQFEEITFTDFINGLDNSMSVAYYIVTRVVPLIILCLLTLMLLISMVSDIPLVQIFCDRVIDPVKILTFGNHNIQTVRNTYLIVSLIIALTIMGIIQAGNLEKIIIFCIKLFYEFMTLFE